MKPVLFDTANLAWTRQMPRRWRAMRLKHSALIRFSGVDKHTVEGEVNVRLCNYLDVYRHERITPSMEFMAATATPEEVRRFALRSGDVLITKDSETPTDIAVPTVVDGEFEGVLCGYHLAMIRPHPRILDSRFLARAFQAVGIREQFHIEANGITRFGLSGDGVASAQFPLPPLDEQRAIADFLDRETTNIDALKHHREHLRHLGQEGLATITWQAVRGTDREVPRTATGIDWLGAIPSHWRVRQVGQIARVVRGGSPRPAADPRYFAGDFLPWITVGEITAGHSKYLDSTSTSLTKEGSAHSRVIDHGVLLLTNSGATLGVPRISRIRGCINDGVVAFENVAPEVSPDFLYWFFRTMTEVYRDRIKQGAGQPNLNTSIVARTLMPVPPIDEQHDIVRRLDHEEARTAQVDGSLNRAAGLAAEYRSALITVAVTGQIDVRHHGSRLQ